MHHRAYFRNKGSGLCTPHQSFGLWVGQGEVGKRGAKFPGHLQAKQFTGTDNNSPEKESAMRCFSQHS